MTGLAAVTTFKLNARSRFRRLELAEQSSELNRCEARLAAHKQMRRTKRLIQIEYGQDKYGWVLQQHPASIATARDLLAQRAGVDVDEEQTISSKGELYGATFAEAFAVHDAILDSAVHRHKADWVCELGCGFGANLARFGPRAYGGELTASGVRLARRLGLDVRPFDFCNPESYALLRPGTTVVTCAALEQLPTAQPFLDGLRHHRDTIASVVHLEPTYRTERCGRLGRLQNEYIVRHDYNVDLEELLNSADDIELLERDVDLIGINPLNSASLYVWRFRT